MSSYQSHDPSAFDGPGSSSNPDRQPYIPIHLRLLCRVTMHDPHAAMTYNVLGPYALLGAMTLAVTTFAAFGLFNTLYLAAGLPLYEVFAVVSVAVVLYLLTDISIAAEARLRDGARARAGRVCARLLLTIGATFIATFGLLLGADHSSIADEVGAAAEAKAEDAAAAARKPFEDRIGARDGSIASARELNSSLETQRQELYASWKDTWLEPCTSPATPRFTCNGRNIKFGPGSVRTREAYDSFVETSGVDIAGNSTAISEAQAANAEDEIKADEAAQRAYDRAVENTGMWPQTIVLWDHFRFSPVMWALAFLLFVLDLSVVIYKSRMPLNGFDMEARARVAVMQRAEAAMASHPSFARATDNFTSHALGRVTPPSTPTAGRGTARPSLVQRLLVGATVVAVIVGAGVGGKIAGIGPFGDERIGNSADASEVSGEGTVPGANTAGATSAAFLPTGQEVSVEVDPRKAFTLQLEDSVTIRGGVGSVAKPGRITAAGVTGTPEDATFSAAGTGVDVTFEGTELTKPVSVTFHDVDVDVNRETVPGVLHRQHDGSLEILPASLNRSGDLSFRTEEFSINLPIEVDLPSWVTDFFSSLGDSIADYVTGRTDPIPTSECDNSGPEWLTVSDFPDEFHSCKKVNPDSSGVARGEVQALTNRRGYQYLRVPDDATSYLWNEDVPDPLRKAAAAYMFEDPSNYVIVPPYKKVTFGFYQPTSDTDYRVAMGSDALSQQLTLVSPIVGLLSGAVEGFSTSVVGAALIVIAACKDELPTALESPENFIMLMKCFSEQALQRIDSPQKAFDQAMNLYGDAAYAREVEGKLSALASKLKWLGRALIVLDLFSSLRNAINDLVTQFKQIFSPTGQLEGRVHLAGVGVTPPPDTDPIDPGASPDSGEPTPDKPDPSKPTPNDPDPDKPTPDTDKPTPTPDPVVPDPVTTPPPPGVHLFLDNYGTAAAGFPMCTGNPNRPESWPAGTIVQQLTANATGSIETAKVQIDPDTSVTALASLRINGVERASTSATASGDPVFSFGSVQVAAGDRIELVITFSSTRAKLITAYYTHTQTGSLSAQNECPDGAPDVATANALRAVIYGKA